MTSMERDAARGGMVSTSLPVVLSTQGYDPLALRFDRTGMRIAVASGMNFGLRGGGRLWIFNDSRNDAIMNPQENSKRIATKHSQACSANNIRVIDTPDALMDVCWSTCGSAIAAAVADGTLMFCGLSGSESLRRIKAHSAETSSVDWAQTGVLSASYDGSLCVHAVDSARAVRLMVLRHGTAHVNEAHWAPYDHAVAASVSADGAALLWDVRTGNQPVNILPHAHDGEALAFGWCSSNPAIFATGGVDQCVRVWDWRQVSQASPKTNNVALSTLAGHRRAVRRVCWVPQSASKILSAGYDMSLRLWDIACISPATGAYTSHTEFVTGLDACANAAATCAWDQSVHILRPEHIEGRKFVL